jgi:hypothetical protein
MVAPTTEKLVAISEVMMKILLELAHSKSLEKYEADPKDMIFIHGVLVSISPVDYGKPSVVALRAQVEHLEQMLAHHARFALRSELHPV